MFTLEHTIFLTESYFKNAERQENCEWKYSIQACVGDFPNTFPNFRVEYPKPLQLFRFWKMRLKILNGELTVGSKSEENTLNICYNC
jgi:hypothetical protein